LHAHAYVHCSIVITVVVLSDAGTHNVCSPSVCWNLKFTCHNWQFTACSFHHVLFGWFCTNRMLKQLPVISYWLISLANSPFLAFVWRSLQVCQSTKDCVVFLSVTRMKRSPVERGHLSHAHHTLHALHCSYVVCVSIPSVIALISGWMKRCSPVTLLLAGTVNGM